jgi:CRP-like cAMP-binding protein
MIKKIDDDELEVVKHALSVNPLFTGLEEFYLDDLLEVGELRSWAGGSQVICEGDCGEAVYFIVSGRAKVTLYSEQGREIVLSVLKRGDMFGEMSIMDEKPRSANVETVKDLSCLVVKKDAFLKYLSVHHRVYRTMFAYLTTRLREATRKIGGLALLDVCGRIAHTLIGMAKPSADDEIVTIERPTHEELAAMIGSSREVVSRALKKMSNEGYIKIEKKQILLFMHQ